MKRRFFAVETPNEGTSFEVKDHLQIGTDMKLIDGQRNVESTTAIPERKVAFKEHIPVERPLNPEETILKSERILDTVRHLDTNPMTVGDLSGLSQRKRKQDIIWIQKRVNRDDVVSVGDLSVMESSEKGLDDLYEDRRMSDIKPSTSESQEVETERREKHREKVAEQLRMRNLMAGGKDERLEQYSQKYLKGKPKEKA